MKTREIISLYTLLIFSLALYVFSGSAVNKIRSGYKHQLHAKAAPLPPNILKAMAGEFRGMVANYLFLEAASFIGSNQKGTPEDWNAVALLLDQSSVLDPYFRPTYRLTQSTLPWEPQKVEEALVILERSKKNLPWDWVPGFFIGFDYFYFLKNNQIASEKLMEASEVPKAPVALASWGARLASKSGHTATAIEFLTAVLEKTDDEKTRETIKKRIQALQGVLQLQTAVDQFRNTYGRLPATLDELIAKTVISAFPVNPYNRPYVLFKGNIEF